MFKYGDKVKYKENKYFVETPGKRVTKTRRIFPDDPNINPGGQLSPAITKIKTKDLFKL